MYGYRASVCEECKKTTTTYFQQGKWLCSKCIVDTLSKEKEAEIVICKIQDYIIDKLMEITKETKYSCEDKAEKLAFKLLKNKVVKLPNGNQLSLNMFNSLGTKDIKLEEHNLEEATLKPATSQQRGMEEFPGCYVY